jgi:hypothetical protein
MKLRPLLIAALLVLLPTSAFAASSGVTPLDEISTLRASTSLYNIVIANTASQHGCNSWKRSFYIYLDDPNAHEMFRLLTVSMLSGRKVALTWACSGSAAKISQVSVGPE